MTLLDRLDDATCRMLVRYASSTGRSTRQAHLVTLADEILHDALRERLDRAQRLASAQRSFDAVFRQSSGSHP